ANLRDVAPFDIDFAPPPKGPSGRRNLQWGSNAWSIMATSEHPDEAWEHVKFLMSEPGQIIFSALGLPGLRSVAQSQVFLEPWDGYRYDLVLDGVAGYSHSYYPTEDWNQWTAESAAVLRQ